MEHSNKKENDESIINNEKFILEYPLNYNEIVDRKLKMLDQEYADTLKCNIKPEDLGSDEEESDNQEPG
jgi:hypothetical protein